MVNKMKKTLFDLNLKKSLTLFFLEDKLTVSMRYYTIKNIVQCNINLSDTNLYFSVIF